MSIHDPSITGTPDHGPRRPSGELARMRHSRLNSSARKPTGRSVIPEGIFQNQSCSTRHLLLREDVSAQRQSLLCTVQVQVLQKEPDVLGITTSRGQYLHSEQVFWRCRGYPQPGMVEYPRRIRVTAWGDVGTSLFVQPPPRQA